MFHQGIDPAHRIGGTRNLVFGTQGKIEAVSRVRQPALLYQPGDGGGEGSRLLADIPHPDHEGAHSADRGQGDEAFGASPSTRQVGSIGSAAIRLDRVRTGTN